MQTDSPSADRPAPGDDGHGPSRTRVFLFLQGPHGPFFAGLGRMLRQAGCGVLRVGFNAGDSAFWPDRASYVPYRGPVADWPEALEALVAAHGVTDIVLYGDTRPVHAAAVRLGKAQGLTVHVFEEGYLRPYWVTYERGGSNGHSRLMQMSLPEMECALARAEAEPPMPPAHWGDMRQHIFYGALYHGFVLFMNRGYPQFRPHRDVPVSREFAHYTRQMLTLPLTALRRRYATRAIHKSGVPYHLALLQLDHDASFLAHSPFPDTLSFLGEVIAGFARGAPGHHHLVVKAHPLDSGRVPLRREIRALADRHGLAGRVHFIGGGKLARLLDHARSAVTVNSTAGQQVLWRGIPLRVFGRAVYAKPEFVTHQPLEAFFAAPAPPDARAYRVFRRYLLQTSQLPGGFYSRSGRGQLLRQVADRMLSPADPYDSAQPGSAAQGQQLRAV
ncbi:capsular polysaccharide export protein [Cribrihabitans marinus]|uniref:Capsular polysaccharide export protein n=1 Tax=Cribrihabitans marinus TaxID=1227549 RepID=A0A1H6RJ99_9RHOB|nr:capsular biosynthesis protein [Cribrihabitans marinus]GGH20548.1 capsule biosynthesis protein CapA [Cribrihabitans marinus]SEI51282.1 capsular polysaccharide export protein [Cribrihabitans marinus]